MSFWHNVTSALNPVNAVQNAASSVSDIASGHFGQAATDLTGGLLPGGQDWEHKLGPHELWGDYWRASARATQWNQAHMPNWAPDWWKRYFGTRSLPGFGETSGFPIASDYFTQRAEGKSTQEARSVAGENLAINAAVAASASPYTSWADIAYAGGGGLANYFHASHAGAGEGSSEHAAFAGYAGSIVGATAGSAAGNAAGDATGSGTVAAATTGAVGAGVGATEGQLASGGAANPGQLASNSGEAALVGGVTAGVGSAVGSEVGSLTGSQSAGNAFGQAAGQAAGSAASGGNSDQIILAALSGATSGASMPTNSSSGGSPSYTNADGSVNWAALVGTAGQVGVDLYNSNQAQHAGQNAAAIADPFAGQRPQYQQMLANLINNPSSVTQLPGYQFRFDQGMQALMRGEAKAGMLGSGNMGYDLINYGQNFATSEFQNEEKMLAELSGYNVGSPGAAGSLALQGSYSSINQQNQAISAISQLAGLFNQNNSSTSQPYNGNYSGAYANSDPWSGYGNDYNYTDTGALGGYSPPAYDYSGGDFGGP